MSEHDSLSAQELREIAERASTELESGLTGSAEHFARCCLRLAAEVERLRSAVEHEREACVQVAEDRLRSLDYGHGQTGYQAVAEIINAIRQRGQLDTR